MLCLEHPLLVGEVNLGFNIKLEIENIEVWGSRPILTPYFVGSSLHHSISEIFRTHQKFQNPSILV